MDNDRIGGLGVTHVNNYIWNAGYMKPDIRHHDNIPIWDGDIYVYSTEDDLKNHNFTFRIPTQVKSHFYENGDFPESTKYSIETNNLNHYLAEGGVVFFLVYVRKNVHQIYVNYLTKKKIKEAIQGKESQKYISFVFNKITTNEKEFLDELNSLYLQRRYSTKPILEINPNDTIEIVFDKDRYGLADAKEEEISQFMASHHCDILFKAHGGSEYFYPAEGKLALSKVEQFVGQIKFGEYSITTYYSRRTSEIGYVYEIENGWLTFIRPYDQSRCVTLNLTYNFHTYRETIRVCKIIDNLLSSNTVTFGSDILEIPPYEKNDPNYLSIRSAIDFWFRIEKLCEVLHIYHDFSVKNMTNENIEKFKMLYAAYIDKKEVTSSILEDHLSLTVINDLKIVSLVKITHDNKAVLVDFADQMAVVYRKSDEPEKFLIATPFTAAFASDYIPSNLQLDNICASYNEAYKHNPNLIDRANLDLLCLINHYDKSNLKELLKAGVKLANWILDNCSKQSYHIHYLNVLQLKERQGKIFNETECEWLSNLYDETTDCVTKFVCSVLLKEKYRADRLLKSLTEEERTTIKQWPIINLYNKLSS